MTKSITNFLLIFWRTRLNIIKDLPTVRHEVWACWGKEDVRIRNGQLPPAGQLLLSIATMIEYPTNGRCLSCYTSYPWYLGLLSNLRTSNLIRFDAKSNRIELRIQIRIRVESNNNFVCSIRFDSSKRRGFLFIIAIWALWFEMSRLPLRKLRYSRRIYLKEMHAA